MKERQHDGNGDGIKVDRRKYNTGRPPVLERDWLLTHKLMTCVTKEEYDRYTRLRKSSRHRSMSDWMRAMLEKATRDLEACVADESSTPRFP